MFLYFYYSFTNTVSILVSKMTLKEGDSYRQARSQSIK